MSKMNKGGKAWPLAVRAAAGAVVVAGAAVLATPSAALAADVGTNCDGDVSMGFSATKITSGIAIKVDGITYGQAKVGLYNYAKSGTPYHQVAFAVADTRSDGKAPYIRAWETVAGGTTTGGGDRVISHRGNGGGWVCFNYLGLYKVTKIALKGSIADAPSVPEPTLVTINY